MIFIWGRKRVDKPMGRVADFCPICRNIRPFKVFRIGMAGHVYYIPTGEGKLIGYERECTVCGLRLGADPKNYTDFDRNRSTSVEGLIAKTSPNIRARFADRLTSEKQLLTHPRAVSDEIRRQYLAEPFTVFNGTVERVFAGRVPMDLEAALGFIGTIVSLVAILFLATKMNLDGKLKDQLAVAAGTIFGIGIIFSLVQMYLRPYRYVRRKILPFLVGALKPLQPTQIEINACLEQCRSMRMKIGKKVKAEQIWAELMRQFQLPAESLPKKTLILSTTSKATCAGFLASIALVAAYAFIANHSSAPTRPISNVPVAQAHPAAPSQPAVKPQPADTTAPTPASPNLATRTPAPMPAQSPDVVGAFIPAPERADMVYDSKRDLLYISSGDSVLRYQIKSKSFLPPLVIGGQLRGVDISSNCEFLAVADAVAVKGLVVFHLVDLETGTDSPVSFPTERMESGTYAVAFGADDSIWITTSFNGSGGRIPLRKYNPATRHTTVISQVGQDTMLVASADREFIAYAESDVSPGTYGRFRSRASALQPPLHADGYLYEVGIDRTGTQMAVPQYSGVILSGSTTPSLDEKDVLSIAYHPRKDFVFVTQSTRPTITVLETTNYTTVKELNFGAKFEWVGNHAYKDGRIRLSNDGNLIFCSVPGGVRYAETGI